MKSLERKVYKNCLIGERLTRLNMEEKKQVVIKLLANMSERELAEETGISHSTIHDWKTGRQNNTEELIHVSLATIVRKLRNFKPTCNDDYLKLHEIKNIVDKLLAK